MRFSIRDLGVAIALFCAMLAAFFRFGLMIAALAGMAIGLGLIVVGRRSDRAKTWWMGVTLTVPFTLLSMVTVTAWQLFGYGPVFLQSSWPNELKKMVAITRADSSSVRVHGLGDFLDAETCWRLPANSQDVKQLSKSLSLQQVNGQQFPKYFWQAFPWSWRPKKDEPSEFFVGDTDVTLYVMFDRRAKLLYVLSHFDF